MCIDRTVLAPFGVANFTGFNHSLQLYGRRSPAATFLVSPTATESHLWGELLVRVNVRNTIGTFLEHSVTTNEVYQLVYSSQLMRTRSEEWLNAHWTPTDEWCHRWLLDNKRGGIHPCRPVQQDIEGANNGISWVCGKMAGNAWNKNQHHWLTSYPIEIKFLMCNAIVQPMVAHVKGFWAFHLYLCR